MNLIAAPLVALFDAAVESARVAAKVRRRERIRQQNARTGRCHVLHPGVDTPLWNELVRRIRPHLRARGTKAQLGRLLAVPRQRIHQCFVARTAMLDAERTMLVIGWMVARESGRDIGTPPLGVS
ncbi:MAG: hypothetical protein C0518_15575 [Opitutus sp.]|nr:hypothetical protein [Opitutus sp.]